LRAFFLMVTDRELYSRTTAAVIADYGYTHLARILNVTVRDLERWAAGQNRPPTHVFLLIIDLANAEAKEAAES
jgi:hypothetical protein